MNLRSYCTIIVQTTRRQRLGFWERVKNLKIVIYGAASVNNIHRQIGTRCRIVQLTSDRAGSTVPRSSTCRYPHLPMT